jgi:hypothetical protein
MTRHWLASGAAFAMMTGVAFAQSSSSDTTTTPVPVVGSFSTSKTQKIIDSNGTETSKSQSYSRGSDETNASSSS